MSQYRIGEFSRVTGLTVKALRHYQEEGLLAPRWIDEDNGYRYYDDTSIEEAFRVRTLRELGFSVMEIRRLMESGLSDLNIKSSVEEKLQQLRERMAADRQMEKRLLGVLRLADVTMLSHESISHDAEAEGPVVRRMYPDTLVLSCRFRGRYAHSGQFIQKMARAAGRHAAGPPFCLYYDGDYRENDADIEVCLPVRKPLNVPGVGLRTVPGRNALTCLHIGPYARIGRAYRTLVDGFAADGLSIELPFREEYVKGPRMLFRGNPDNYRTEISAGIATTDN